MNATDWLAVGPGGKGRCVTAEKILTRLDWVRKIGQGRWSARCPAHDDRKPSLTVREADDGRVLLYCFAGCETGDVLNAIGRNWGDLFEPRKKDDEPKRRRREPLVHPADALRVLAHEVRIVVLLAGDLSRGESISEIDRQRLLVTAGRLAKAETACHL